jgi:murein DD-endopeptidase MepM/ murein hydrolase activator NlpD
MFGAAGAAVATSAKTQNAGIGKATASTKSPRPTTTAAAAMRASQASKASQASQARTTEATRASKVEAVQQDLATIRASAVARGVERTKIESAKRAAFAHSWRLPISNPVTTSGFGYRWGRLHAGEDFAVSTGTPLVSMSTGTVAFAGEESGFGNLVEIRYWDGTVSYFAHMSVVSVNVGESVEPGEIVGQSGNTGHSTGPHLHLEIHPDGGEAVDPLPWLTDHHISA